MKITLQSNFAYLDLNNDYTFGLNHLLEFFEHVFYSISEELLNIFYIGFINSSFVTSFFDFGLDFGLH